LRSSSQAASSGPHQTARAPSCRASTSSRLRAASGGKSTLLRSPRIGELLRCRSGARRWVFHKGCVGSPSYAGLAAPCRSQYWNITYINVLSASISPGSLDGRDVAVSVLYQSAVNIPADRSMILTGLALVLLYSTKRVCDRALSHARLSVTAVCRSPYFRTEAYLWEIDTERVHVEPVQEAGKILAESG